ncbi:hypothetical protein B296_00011607 [Ensete ventricosum]|uniref:Uncharacterized protein n=1 Tax=Ensete ventricosum TaxID=4639 RepID=A0A427AR79_ENSVE|nr:hypothetical protein B296_00011607 [Ensete ventricosum]
MDWWTGRDMRLGQRTGGLAKARDSGKELVYWPRYATQAKDWWTGRDMRLGRFCRLHGKSKRHCPYKPPVNGGEGSLLILLLSEPSDLTPLGRSVPFYLLTDQVGMASTPSFSVSSFSSSLSSHVPPSREKRRRSIDFSGNQSVPESSSSGVMTGAEAKVLQALEVIKSLHDLDSTICLESLGSVRRRFSIPDEYVLHAPRSRDGEHEPDAWKSTGRGWTSWDCALGSDSSIAASINLAQQVRFSFRRTGDPCRGGQGALEASRKCRGGDSASQKKKRVRRHLGRTSSPKTKAQVGEGAVQRPSQG